MIEIDEKLRAGLTPRQIDVLCRLLEGDSVKQAAQKLGISSHTVHTSVKVLHAHFDVTSRGELLSKVFLAMLAEYTQHRAVGEPVRGRK